MRFIERIYGRVDGEKTCYLTRIQLWRTKHKGAGLYLHIFHRGDWDPDPHDHPWDFWTFPLTSYYEQRMAADGYLYINKVPGWRWTFLPATYAHRVLGRRYKMEDLEWGFGTYTGLPGSIVTLVWHEAVSRKWGFWVPSMPDMPRELPRRGVRRWMPWREYVYGPKYLSEEEIVEDLLRELDAQDLERIRALHGSRLIVLHHSLGQWIRNHYKLWAEDNPHVVLNPRPSAKGVIDHPLFPDQVSQRIIEKLWVRLRG